MRAKQTTMAIAAMAAVALTLGACNQSPTTESQAGSPGAAVQPGTSVGKLAEAGTSAGTAAPSSSPSAMAQSSSDSAIKSQVTAALNNDPTLKAAGIKVEAQAGTVTLSGSVATNDMRMHAQQIAATTPGVTKVIDDLAVKNAS